MRKKVLLSIGIGLVCTHIYGQQLEIANNATLELANGVSFYANGLTLKPSALVAFSGLSILPKAGLSNQTLGTAHIARVYELGANAPAFTGDITIQYLDSELDGLAESSLQLAVYNNNLWQYATTSVLDSDNNFITATLNNVVLGELTLGPASTLPLKWGTLTAKRQNMVVKLAWQTENEQNVDYFMVERSSNGQHWQGVGSRIAAQNLMGTNFYEQLDRPNTIQRLYYRIKQYDTDGKESASALAVVNGTASEDIFSIYPNPSRNYFTLKGIAESDVKEVELYDLNGRTLKKWGSYLSSYDINGMAGGLHFVKLTRTDGATVTIKLLIEK